MSKPGQEGLPELPEPEIFETDCDGYYVYDGPGYYTADQMIAYARAAKQLMEERKDAAYLERNQVVAALAKCFPPGIKRTAIEGWSDDWHGCVYIDLPTGQVSWHFHDSHAHLFASLPPYAKEWDGHTTDEKYARLAALAQSTPPADDPPLPEPSAYAPQMITEDAYTADQMRAYRRTTPAAYAGPLTIKDGEPVQKAWADFEQGSEYVLVPREPTAEMVDACIEYMPCTPGGRTQRCAESIWRAMIAAAQAQQDGGEQG